MPNAFERMKTRIGLYYEVKVYYFMPWFFFQLERCMCPSLVFEVWLWSSKCLLEKNGPLKS